MLTLTYTNKHTRKSRKINLNRLFCSLLVLTLIITCIGLYVDFVRFPEKYLTTWKYQLHNEIKAGNQKSIDYYNKHYTSKGVYLFGEDEEPESDFINLATVTSYEASVYINIKYFNYGGCQNDYFRT